MSPKNTASVSPTGQALVKVSAQDLRAKKTPTTNMNASDFIRSQPTSAKVTAVIEAGRKIGLTISSNLVYMVRSRARKEGAAPSKRAPRRPHHAGAAPVAPPITRGPGRPRRDATVPISTPKRGPRRPRKVGLAVGALTADEKQMAALILRVGLDRTEQLVRAVRQSLARRR